MAVAIIIALVAVAAGLVLSRKKKSKPNGSYKSFQGDAYTLQELRGPTISLLVPKITDECKFILDYCERAHEHYRRETGHTHERINIAVVDKTCGAGCGYLGTPGIEIMAPYWLNMLDAAKRKQADQIPLYELGRNYWRYQSMGELTTGFAIFHRMLIARGLDMAPFGGKPWEQFDAEITGLIDRYIADGLKFEDTFAAGKGVPGHYGGADLWASLLLRMYRDFDMTGFWRRMDKDGFLKAAPKAAQDWLVSTIGWK